jgi:hypothetical protein
MASITLKGREIPLLYTTFELKALQEEIAPFSRMINIILGRNPDDEKDTSGFGGSEHLEAVAKLIRILGNAGLEEEGREPDLTDRWVLRHMKPGMIMVYVIAVVAVISDGNKVESTTTEEEQGPVDEGLEEQNAKKQPGN